MLIESFNLINIRSGTSDVFLLLVHPTHPLSLNVSHRKASYTKKEGPGTDLRSHYNCRVLL